ncbi:TetR/AcrR family transcriptional regulator [Eisenbergiella sp. OF01-20]|nr:TetR/AcrR family transcriptional regulator [Eisenbergiella sp. OF01-20]
MNVQILSATPTGDRRIYMGAERKTQQRTIESRKKLLHAAYKLFVEKGYYNTNTKEITRYAGISIGNFYNYYQDKGEIYCALLREYTADSCRAMQELTDQLTALESRSAYKDFLSSYLRQLLSRAADTKKFFEDSIVIAKENPRIQSILSGTEEDLTAIMETFLRNRYPDKQEDFHIKARMVYVITDKVAKDILKVDNKQQKEVYMQYFIELILHFSFDL